MPPTHDSVTISPVEEHWEIVAPPLVSPQIPPAHHTAVISVADVHWWILLSAPWSLAQIPPAWPLSQAAAPVPEVKEIVPDTRTFSTIPGEVAAPTCPARMPAIFVLAVICAFSKFILEHLPTNNPKNPWLTEEEVFTFRLRIVCPPPSNTSCLETEVSIGCQSTPCKSISFSILA